MLRAGMESTRNFLNYKYLLEFHVETVMDGNNQNYTSVVLIGAYVYPEYISITLNSQYMVKQRLYCRYFDCKKQEISGSSWQGIVFPESVIHCPRRIGAEFVSVSKYKTEDFPNPMRLKFRNFEKPIHEFAICVAPLYGQEPKWIQIVEFIEHHKMEGATLFYFHIGNISDYDRKVLDEYENNGDIEVKVLQEKYERPFYAWQLIEIQDCHMRAKYHSKWTAFIDIDERISTQNGRISDFLNSEDNRKVAEIQMPILNIAKYEDAPMWYQNEGQVRREMISNKYDKTPGPSWNASKAIIRPEKIGIMSIHYAIALEHGYVSLRSDSSKIVLRHYRSTQHRENLNDWDKEHTLFGSPLPQEFSSELTKKVFEKTKSIYEKVPVNCSTIPEDMWKSRQFPDPCQRMLLTW
ncbi:hypothetical protein GCK72_019853 [Caenorhabditis remanei]|uniref:Glycosyltransferase family 92 protein n=1 Tax=Caenorhabditis remanei TaxID=31234 RepID=A0A6A5GDG7_CAERE|nr:hypothetical protein GCK72_019853 [Caenorhabditis remanei]KAF1753297.1 hypothetical protein GCK72_019853 [Caenorhabditis remanei]